MGVDYDANYGIGIQVKVKEFEEDSEYYEDFQSYLDNCIGDLKIQYFQVGEGSYTGEEDEFYVTIEDPFDEGYDIANKAKDLISFLDLNEIEYIGKVDLIGGLRVW